VRHVRCAIPCILPHRLVSACPYCNIVADASPIIEVYMFVLTRLKASIVRAVA
jgi:hypothetical protein